MDSDQTFNLMDGSVGGECPMSLYIRPRTQLNYMQLQKVNNK